MCECSFLPVHITVLSVVPKCHVLSSTPHCMSSSVYKQLRGVGKYASDCILCVRATSRMIYLKLVKAVSLMWLRVFCV